MKNFFLSLFGPILNASLNGAASASNAGADLKTVGISAGVTALAGLLQALLLRPAAQHPAVTAALVAQTPK
jgi:hypothetical protein